MNNGKYGFDIKFTRFGQPTRMLGELTIEATQPGRDNRAPSATATCTLSDEPLNVTLTKPGRWEMLELQNSAIGQRFYVLQEPGTGRVHLAGTGDQLGVNEAAGEAWPIR